MKNHKKLLLGVVLLVIAVGSVTTWAVSRASTKQQTLAASAKPQAVNTRYLQTFFRRYVEALNSGDVDRMMSFYAPDAVSTMAWGKEMNNRLRAEYFQSCKQAFPQAQISVKKVMIVPIDPTSGYITWDFGMIAGKQVKPFMGVMGLFKKPEPGKIYDQEGVSTGQVGRVDKATKDAMAALEKQISTLDEEILSLDEKIAALNESFPSEIKGPSVGLEGSDHASEKFSLARKRSDLAEQRDKLDQKLLDKAVSSMKFTRQSSYQNMDAFLKKIGDK